MPLNGAKIQAKNVYEGFGITFEILRTLQQKYGFTYNLTKLIPPVIGDSKNGALGKLVSRVSNQNFKECPWLGRENNYWLKS